MNTEQKVDGSFNIFYFFIGKGIMLNVLRTEVNSIFFNILGNMFLKPNNTENS